VLADANEIDPKPPNIDKEAFNPDEIFQQLMIGKTKKIFNFAPLLISNWN